jgi:hypothetical protein
MDIYDYCTRNRRMLAEQEAKMQQLAKEREEERKRFELENERKLVELLNEINNQLLNENEAAAEAATDSDGFTIEINEKENDESKDDKEKKSLDYVGEINFEDDLDLLNEDDELLKKILSHRHINVLSVGNDANGTDVDLTSPIVSPSNEDIVNLFNIVDGTSSNHSKKHNENGKSARKAIKSGETVEEDEFQLVENDLNVTPIKEADLNVVVFRSTPKNIDINHQNDSNRNNLDDKMERRKYKGKNIMEQINAVQKSEDDSQPSELEMTSKLEENNTGGLEQFAIDEEIINLANSLIDQVVDSINADNNQLSQLINHESSAIINSNSASNQSNREENSSNSIEVLAKYSKDSTSNSFTGSQISASTTTATTLSATSSITSSDCSQSTSVNDSSIEVMPPGSDMGLNDDEDSDIEVIVATTKKNKNKHANIDEFANKKLNIIQQEKKDPMIAFFDINSKQANVLTSPQVESLSRESALLTSITEKEVDSLLVNKRNFQLASIKNSEHKKTTQNNSQTDDDRFMMLNYDLINEDSSPLNSFDSMNESIVNGQIEKSEKEKSNNQSSSLKTLQRPLVDYSLNSTEDSSFLLNQNQVYINSSSIATNAAESKQDIINNKHNEEKNLNENEINRTEPNEVELVTEITESKQNLNQEENEIIEKEKIKNGDNFEKAEVENCYIRENNFNQIDLTNSIIENGSCSNGDIVLATVTSESTKVSTEYDIDKLNKQSIVAEQTDSNQAANGNNSNTDSKPFFASKLTNSQLSEELSNEIGL